MTKGENSLPLYRSIAADIQNAIERGDFADGSTMPSENELTATYRVSRGTIRQAFAFLRSTGVVSSRRGARRQIRSGPRVQSMSELVSFSLWACSLGETPSSRTLSVGVVPASDAVADKLGVPEGANVFHTHRVRLLSDVPTMIESTYYPESLAPLIAAIDLDTQSITDRLGDHGIVFADAEHAIAAVAATPGEAQLLGLAPGAPLLRTIRRTTNPLGEVLECSIDLYAAESVAFVVRNSLAAGGTSRVGSRRDT
ncbi:GntR family transcriptional regulator [Rhodococcus sp. H29-C3]|uniref:GntR family transcriptional regulator n=1 Tax=Rhodococcus sp. H29-C3 TaxID=3046307 RepID=UPI0024BBAF10|nr:GntR family transcriptional regulator [Rhodococcus sp. H29-C3]MDJ0359317.1 GntR family transcriptional regulator [Rhodococcus sp. H29-C3]